jgi:hypothetical protein
MKMKEIVSFGNTRLLTTELIELPFSEGPGFNDFIKSDFQFFT